MQIKRIRRTRSKVYVEYETDGQEIKVTAHEPPLKAFDDALQALGPLVLQILDLPKSYLGAKSEEEDKLVNPLTITGVTITEKQESRLLTIVAKKDLPDAHSPFNITTPLRFMEHPAEEGSYSPSLTDKQCALVDELIEEAKKYVNGERAQGTLPLGDDDDAAEPVDGDAVEAGA